VGKYIVLTIRFLQLKRFVRSIPILGKIVGSIYYKLKKEKPFPGSEKYWEYRYANGGNSGAGSYNLLARFKADILNEFVATNAIERIIEFGCGDGNQLTLAQYPDYIGFDVSETAVSICKNRFKSDTKKAFRILVDYYEEKADLVLSLDVIYHLIEDEIFEKYMQRLFKASTKYVIIYSIDVDGPIMNHVRAREFTKYIKENITNWELIKHIPNKYPYQKDKPDETSWSAFFFYKKIL
jgi:hypothetical protein